MFLICIGATVIFGGKHLINFQHIALLVTIWQPLGNCDHYGNFWHCGFLTISLISPANYYKWPPKLNKNCKKPKENAGSGPNLG